MQSNPLVRGPIRGVLFDLDNTLVHRSRSIERYAKQFVEDFSGSLEPMRSEEVARLIECQDNGGYLPGDSQFATIREAVAHSLANNVLWQRTVSHEEIAVHWARRFPECAVEMEGAQALIAALAARGLRIGIVSNGAEKSRAATVAQLGFREHIALVLSSERAGIRKPEAEIFSAAAREMGLANEECLFVGDHPINDVAGALSAGMAAIWLEGFHAWPAELKAQASLAASLQQVGVLIEALHQ